MKRLILAAVALVAVAVLIATWQLLTVQPATSERFAAWQAADGKPAERGRALFSYGDFGALDLDTLETSAVPWVLVAASLALAEAGGDGEAVNWPLVRQAFRKFGFLYPREIASASGGLTDVAMTVDAVPQSEVPFGMTVGLVKRMLPPIRLRVLNIGCAACHAGPAYRAEGVPDTSRAVPGMPNSGLDLEAFTLTSYRALTAAFAAREELQRSIDKLFPDMGSAERATLNWLAMPAARKRLAKLAQTIARPLPFLNGAPGLTNGIAAIKHQLQINDPSKVDLNTGFVSVPVLSDRFFRSALLADSAYGVPGSLRSKLKTREDVAAMPAKHLAGIASLFLVPSMGLSPERAMSAVADLTDVAEYLRDLRPPRFPGPVNRDLTARGRDLYASRCARCHGTYNDSLTAPRLLSFPNWLGDVGSDASRPKAFTPRLQAAIARTPQGKAFIDPLATRKSAAPLLAGLWASAPYFTNGSIPTVRQVLEPSSRPTRFMTGGHALDLENLGVRLVAKADGAAVYPSGYVPYSKPVMIDTRKAGFSNAGHETESSSLTRPDRDALIEYLKLL